MKIGLVLEGGAMRGMFTAGVLDVLMEHEIWLDGMVGVSAGAAFGCNYKSRQIGRAIRYNMRYAGDWRFCSLRSLLLTGDLFGADFCYKTIPEQLDKFDYETFRRSEMPFFAVCTDARTGRAVYSRLTDCAGAQMDVIRASASLPLVSHPVAVGEEEYLDGGIVDPIPLAFMEQQGHERNIVVLTQPLGYQKKAVRAGRLLHLLLRKYPHTAHMMLCRHETYNSETAYVAAQETAGKAFVIRPPRALGISRTERNPEKLKTVYDLGRQVMTDRLDELNAFIAAARSEGDAPPSEA